MKKKSIHDYAQKRIDPRIAYLSVFALAWVYDIVCAEETIQMPTITIKAQESGLVEGQGSSKLMIKKRYQQSDTAQLLRDIPDVSLQSGGRLGSIPVINGMGDDRVRITVDGMSLSAPCPNHMNPVLSTIPASQVDKFRVYSGVAPVSMGGDNIGGVITVDSSPLIFASLEHKHIESGSISSYYRSNDEATGMDARANFATRFFSIGYGGAWAGAKDYVDGAGKAVTSTYYQRANHALTLAFQGEAGVFSIKVSHQNVPREGFVNQHMDLIGDESDLINFLYKGIWGWGSVKVRTYWQEMHHAMNVGDDKSTFKGSMWMPMNTKGRDLGYAVDVKVALSENHNLKIGNEWHRQSLDDWWPPVPDSMASMGPNTFLSINNGKRDQFGTYLQWDANWSDRLGMILGVRNDVMKSDTGLVDGFSSMYAKDAVRFNEQIHGRTDYHWDWGILARYTASGHNHWEFGYAHKTRSPSLYERYSWSRMGMAAMMINWVGDGNAYVGNLDLEPEEADILSVAANWHDVEKKQWEVSLTPYYSYVRSYIDVNKLMTLRNGRNLLQFSNHKAQIYGVNASANINAWDSVSAGKAQVTAVVSWVKGSRIDTGEGLYHMMPFNAKVGFMHTFGAWFYAVDAQGVFAKSTVDLQRLEPETAGYALLGLRAGYKINKQWRFDASIDNLFDANYALPLGGINMDQRLANGKQIPFLPVMGVGRSFNVGVSMMF